MKARLPGLFMCLFLQQNKFTDANIFSFDILLLSIDLSVEKLQLNHLAEMLVPGGVVLSLVHGMFAGLY